MDEETLALYARHVGALDWLAGLEITKPVVACIGYHRVMRDARIVKGADSVSATYQPVVLGISGSGSYQCVVENGIIGISCPDPELLVRKFEVEVDDRLTARLELEAVLLWPIVKALQPVVIHAHDVMGLRAAALIKLWLQSDGLATPVIYDSHEYIRGLEPTARAGAMAEMQDRCIEATDGLITVSASILNSLRAEYGYNKPACVVYNCPPKASDGDTGLPDLKSRLGLPADTPLGVWTGSVSLGSGAHTFISALKFIPDLHLAFFTSRFGQFFRDLIDLARRSGCEDRVHSVPTVDYRVVPDAIVGADFGFVGFIPYIKNHEFAMPNKFFEYVQAGIPLVVSNVLEMGAFVARYAIGEVFEPESVGACAAAMQRVLDKTRSSYLSRLRALAATYNWQYQAIKIEDIYAAVIDGEVALATDKVAVPAYLRWLTASDWRRQTPPRRVASNADTLSIGRIAVPVPYDNSELQLRLQEDLGQIILILKDLDKVKDVADGGQAQRLFDGVTGVLRDLLNEPTGGLLPNLDGPAGDTGEVTLDAQLNVLEALLIASRTIGVTGVRDLCGLIVTNFCRRVECGGLVAGPPGEHFLLRSRSGAPANSAVHIRVIRTLDRLALRLEFE